MLTRRQATSPVETSVPLPSSAVRLRLARRRRARKAAHVQFDVVEEAKVGAALADRKMLGEMPVGAEGFDAEFRDAKKLVRVGTFAERQEDVGAGIVGNRSIFLFFDRAAARQAANRVGQPGRAARRHRRIERLDRNFLRRAGNVREHLRHPVRLEVEQAAAIGDDGELVLVGLDGNAVQRLFEQIDARRGVKGEELLADRRGELRLHIVESHHDIDGLRLRAAGDRAEAERGRSRESAGETRNSRAGNRSRETAGCRSGSGPRFPRSRFA